jgi:hypothetical protein
LEKYTVARGARWRPKATPLQLALSAVPGRASATSTRLRGRGGRRRGTSGCGGAARQTGADSAVVEAAPESRPQRDQQQDEGNLQCGGVPTRHTAQRPAPAPPVGTRARCRWLVPGRAACPLTDGRRLWAPYPRHGFMVSSFLPPPWCLSVCLSNAVYNESTSLSRCRSPEMMSFEEGMQYLHCPQ